MHLVVADVSSIVLRNIFRLFCRTVIIISQRNTILLQTLNLSFKSYYLLIFILNKLPFSKFRNLKNSITLNDIPVSDIWCCFELIASSKDCKQEFVFVSIAFNVYKKRYNKILLFLVEVISGKISFLWKINKPKKKNELTNSIPTNFNL